MWKLFSVIITPKADRFYCRIFLNAAANFLNDQTTYLGTQLESEFGGERCFGVLAGMDFILISTYGPEGEAPELVLYKKR